MRRIPSSMEARVVVQIDARLAAVIRDHTVAIPLAIESGSRAWGFASPDSDYDCRFIFLRRAEEYLSPWPRRDVIETPLDPILDVGGWDLAKALKLLLKGNAVIIEWLTSPITYAADRRFRSELLALARQIVDRNRIARHYLHLGQRQRRTYFGDGTSVAQKKIFYALRPAAALRWLRLHPRASIAPMHFPTLMKGCEPSAQVVKLVDRLIARKAVTRELEAKPLPAPIANFVDREFQRADKVFGQFQPPASESARQRAEAFFLSTLNRLAPKI